jgi:hypothetical protein
MERASGERMTKPIELILFMFLASPFVRADEASKRAKIEDLMAATHIEQTLQQQQAQMKALLHDMILKNAPASENNPKLAKIEEAVFNEVQSATKWEVLKPDFIKVYEETFTEEEVGGLANFYRSPLGQVVIAKMPEIMTKSMAVTQERLQGLLPRLQQRVQELQSGENEKPH